MTTTLDLVQILVHFVTGNRDIEFSLIELGLYLIAVRNRRGISLR